MNSQRNLLSRMLHLFPVATIKREFDPKEKKHAPILTEIIDSNSSSDIINFVFGNIGYTKQHIYLFSNTLGYKKAIQHGFAPLSLKKSITVAGVQSDNFLLKQIYNLQGITIPNGDFQRVNLEFYQPLTIEISNANILLKFTILEPNPKNYIDNFNTLTYKRANEDEEIVQNFVDHIYNTMNVYLQPLDINRGVKKMWDDDKIDAISVRYKKVRSMVTEVMDEHYTFKKQNPERFKEAMASPLRKLTFRFLDNPNGDFCDFFTDPTDGIISFNKYPTNINQIKNVVSEIIRNN